MKRSESFAELARRLRNKPEPAIRNEANSTYWGYLHDEVGEVLRSGNDGQELLSLEADFIDFGVVAAAMDEQTISLESLRETEGEFHLRIQSMSEWIAEVIFKLNRGDRKQVLERDIQAARSELGHNTEEVTDAQSARRDILLSASTPAQPAQLTMLEQLDEQTLEGIRTRRSVARGTFLSVQQRREHALREQNVEKQRVRSQSIYQPLSPEERSRITTLNKSIEEAFGKISDLEEKIRKLEEQARSLDQNERLSPVEMANRYYDEVDYVRDMCKLTAKRLHLQSCPFLTGNEKFFTKKTVGECISRILEFDPRVFKNERVGFHGKPSVLLVPGNGNAMFDWKGNRLIVPLVPPGGDFMSSIAAGFIEYRIDVDEEKTMVSSYNQIPEYKEIRSILKLRAQFTKDYVIWMTSEYLGNRILSKDVKDWFERSIAPQKSEPMTPPELQEFALSVDEFKALCHDTEELLTQGIDSMGDHDLWKASIVTYQQAAYDKSTQLLERLIEHQPEHLFAYYNLGQVCLRGMNKQRALWAFGEFCKRKPQSWWARNAREHAQRIQRG